VFEVLDDGGNLDGYDKSIRSMCVSSYTDRLFVGTETYKCAKLLVLDRDRETGASTWSRADPPCTVSISSCLDLGNGKLLFGGWAQLGYDIYLLKENDQDSLTRINTPNRKLLSINMGISDGFKLCQHDISRHFLPLLFS